MKTAVFLFVVLSLYRSPLFAQDVSSEPLTSEVSEDDLNQTMAVPNAEAVNAAPIVESQKKSDFDGNEEIIEETKIITKKKRVRSPEPVKPQVVEPVVKKVAQTSPAQSEPEVSTKEGGDTYNFYFQKGSAPARVEQGGKPTQSEPPESVPAASSPSTPAPKAETRSSVPPINLNPVKKKTVEFELGRVWAKKADGALLQAQWNYGEQTALQLGVIGLEREVEVPYPNNISGLSDLSRYDSVSGGHLGLLWQPTGFLADSNFFKLGFTGGYAWFNSTLSQPYQSWNGSGYSASFQDVEENLRSMYVGAQATFRITGSLGVTVFGKVITSNSDYNHYGVNLALRL